MTNRRTEDFAFEAEVRRTAEAIWGLDPGECQPAWYRNDPVLHELDGIVRLNEISHVIMATTSRRLDKATGDIKKLNAAAEKEIRHGNLAEKWLITQSQLEAQHLDLARKSNVKTLTLNQFRSRFFDGRNYIAKRKFAAFGSARNLRNSTISIPDDEYVELPMLSIEIDNSRTGKSEKAIAVDELVRQLRDGRTIVLTGPYGAGKSLTTREVFLRLATEYLKEKTAQVPLAINLREHWGAIYGDEILERHARSIGFLPRENLTIAWRAGIALLLLDGFDELASQAVAQQGDKNFFRQARADAVQAVRDLVSKIGDRNGILICGRDHYFDDIQEMSHSLGLSRRFLLVRVGEFTETQAVVFLRRHGQSESLPDWLPRKPLILGYLAHQGLLDQVLSIDADRGFGYAWDRFLDLVCEREAQHERAVIQAATLRHVLERLACIVRGLASGTGPISGVDLAEVYRAETGEVAGEGVLMQLQRLPGLTPREQDPTVRSFVDQDMLSALQGSAVARAIAENSSRIESSRWLSGLSRDGIRMAAFLLHEQGYSPSTILATTERFLKSAPRAWEMQLVADRFLVALELARDSGYLDVGGMVLAEAHFTNIDIEEVKLENACFQDCVVESLSIGRASLDSSVRFEDCVVEYLNGAQSEKGLPDGMFRNCEIRRFDNVSTNAAVLRLQIADPLKVLLTILRKLYLQAGGGRKLTALKRGLPDRIVEFVKPIVELLVQEGMVGIFDEVAHPIRRQTARALAILSSGALSKDELVARVNKLARR